MNPSDIIDYIKGKLSFEDIFILALILFFLIERKSDMLFIIILFIIFLAGFKEDLISDIFERGFSNLPNIMNVLKDYMS